MEIPRLVKHKKYGKYLRRRTVCHVHDDKEESHAGDTVEIVECAPKSKLKRWELVRVVKKSQAVDVAALRAASRRKAAEELLAEESAVKPASEGQPRPEGQPQPEST
ncbi:MAG: 30S ribosomal protein S17 [Planctomycetia bacterium 21-64-5]|nr:MAG: 30S ribosomal protein S17 [Planctomycetia bacterium 21-64-5]